MKILKILREKNVSRFPGSENNENGPPARPGSGFGNIENLEENIRFSAEASVSASQTRLPGPGIIEKPKEKHGFPAAGLNFWILGRQPDQASRA